MSVFDTNVYRGLSDADFDELMVLERSRSIVGAVCYQVAEELLAHLVDPADRDFHSALKGITRLARHCQQYDGQRPVLRFLADGLDQVAVSVIGKPLSHDKTAESYAVLIGHVVEAADDESWNDLGPDLQEVARRVNVNRTDFVEGVQAIAAALAKGFGFVDGNLAPLLADKERRRVLCRGLESSGAVDSVASMLYRQVADATGTAVAPEGPPESAIRRITEMFHPALRLFSLVMRKFICDGYNIQKRWSVAYDARIGFIVSGYAKLDGVPVRLVTDDGLLHEGAAAAGVSELVFRPSAYIAALRAGPINVAA